MSDKRKNQDDERGCKKNGEFRVPPRNYIIWIAIIGAIPLLMVFKGAGPASRERLTQPQFQQKVESNLVVRGTITYDPQSGYLHGVQGYYLKTDEKTGEKVLQAGKPVEVPFIANVRLTDKMEDKLFNQFVFEAKPANAVLLGLVYSLGPIL